MVRRPYQPLQAFFIAAAALAVSVPAHAQSVNVLDQIVSQFQSRSAGWESTLRSFALGTFGILASIEMVWAAFKLAFRGSDVSEWLAEIVNQILFLGFFLALLENSVTWGTAIVNSFRQAAGAAGGGGIAPSDVFAAGVKIAAQVLQQMSLWHPEASAGLMVAGIVIEVCFALMAAFMVLALVESYLIISMGVIFMAFGGSRWTQDFAVSTVRFIQSWANSFTDITDASLCILIGCSIVMLAVVKVLPETMQRIVNGSSMASGSALVGAAAAVGAGVGAVGLGMVGAGPMLGNAVRLAGAQVDSADAKAAEASGGEAPPRSRLGRAAAMTGYATRNVTSAPLADVGRRLSGQGSRHGIATWRMSADLENRRRLMQDDNSKPPPPPPPGGSGNAIS
jgi:type IV secretion system protein TrbL